MESLGSILFVSPRNPNEVLLLQAIAPVMTAEDGEDAWEKIRSFSGRDIKLIVSEAKVPKLASGELIQRVRAMGLETPLILLTRSGTPPESHTLTAMKACEWIEVKLSFQPVCDRVRSLLSKEDSKRSASLKRT
jgi:DNA-binding NtrC family response regulator